MCSVISKQTITATVYTQLIHVPHHGSLAAYTHFLYKYRYSTMQIFKRFKQIRNFAYKIKYSFSFYHHKLKKGKKSLW